jgi:hypothetical protein
MIYVYNRARWSTIANEGCLYLFIAKYFNNIGITLAISQVPVQHDSSQQWHNIHTQLLCHMNSFLALLSHCLKSSPTGAQSGRSVKMTDLHLRTRLRMWWIIRRSTASLEIPAPLQQSGWRAAPSIHRLAFPSALRLESVLRACRRYGNALGLIRKVFGSELGQGTGQPGCGFYRPSPPPPQYLEANSGVLPRTYLNHVFPDPFQFNIHQQSYRLCYWRLLNTHPPLWSGGQIRRPGFDSRHY